MIRRDTVGEISSAGAWTVRTDCGHTVTVPWGAAPPFGMALIVQHQEKCSEEWMERPGESVWVPRVLEGGAFR
jgi:hypothetical protein